MKTRTFKFTFAQFSLWAALLLLGSSAYGQRINPATRIQKAPAPDYILLSDDSSEYRHARLDTTIAGGSVTVDTFRYSNDTLYISLSGDGEPQKWVVITGAAVDDQVIDTFAIVNDTLQISLENDGEPAKIVDLTPYLDDTDRQTVDSFFLQNDTLFLTLERDGEAPYSVDLSGIDNDRQTVDTFSYHFGFITLALEGDNEPPYVLDVSQLLDDTDTDDQTLLLVGSSLSISEGNSVDLSPLLDNTDNQTVDSFFISNDTLYLALENDNEAPYFVIIPPGIDSLNDLLNVDATPTTGQVLQWNGTIWTAGTVTSGGDADSDPGNEIQSLSYNPATDEITLSLGGGTIDISEVDTDTDDQTVDTFSLAGTVLTLALESDGEAPYQVDLSPLDTDTDDQTVDTFAIVANTLSIALEGDGEPPYTVDLSPYLDNTDGQTLSLDGSTLSISGGNSVDLSSLGGGTDDQTVDTFSLSGTILTLALEGDNEPPYTVDLVGLGGGTDDQTVDTFAIVSNTLTLALEGDNEAPYSVDLSPYLDNTDGQTLSLVTNTLSITGGNSVDLSGYLDNTDSQTLGLVGTTLSITGGNSVDLASIDTDTDNQTVDSLLLNGTTLILAIEDDGEAPYSVDLASLQDGTGTDDQNLSLVTNTLSIEDGNSVDLSPYLDNTDSQTLGLVGTTLSITGGNSVDLASIDTDTDNQTVDTFSIVSNTLTLALEGDGEAPYTVDLSPYLDNTDGQTLGLVTNTLSITGGNSVDLSGYLDNTDSQTLGLVGTTLSITGGNSVDLAGIDTDTDNQTVDTFSLSGTVLTLALEDDGEAPYQVDLASLVGGSFSVDLNLLRDTLTRAGHGFNQADVPIPVGITKGASASLFTAVASSADSLHSAFIIEVLDANTVVVATEGIFVSGTYHGYLPGRDYFLTGTALVYDTLAPVSMHNDWIWTAIDSFRLALRAARPYDPNEVIPAAEDNQTVDTFSLAGTILTLALENDGEAPYTVDLASLGGGTDDQTVDTFAIVSNTLTLALESDGEAPYTVDLSPYLDNTDGQTLSFNDVTRELSISGGNTVDLSEGIQDEVGALIAAGGGIGVAYDDGGNTLTISNTGDTNASDDLTTSTTFSGDVSGTYSATVVADDSHNHSASTISTNILSSLDGVTNDGGNIDLLASGIVSITPDDGANTITISATEVDGSTTNEIQDLGWTQSTGVLTITSGTSATILPMTGATGVAAGEQGLVPQPTAGQEGLFLRGDGTWAAASGSGDNWGSQVVQVTARFSGDGTAGTPLELAQQAAGSGQVLKWDGSAWTPANDTDTDDQTLSLVTNTLSISEGNSVSLAGYLDNTDSQTLSLAGTTLSITGGNSQDLEYFDPDAMDSQTSGTVDLGSEKQYARIIDMTGLASITITLSNPLDGGAYILLFTNADNTDTVTWPASVKYEDNTAPGTGILSDGRRMVQLLYDGSTFWVPGGYN